MSIRSPLARARGLGSAKSGVEHWWGQRVSAAALVPLTLWFVGSVAVHVDADYESVVNWLASPVHATMIILFLVAVFYHSQHGLQVIVEDYVHVTWVKIGAVVVLLFINFMLAVASMVSVLMILFGVAG